MSTWFEQRGISTILAVGAAWLVTLSVALPFEGRDGGL